MKIVVIAGARPNFIKIAPLMQEMRGRSDLDVRLVHTGQHYDERMSRLFFEELEIPRPDVDLEVGSASHAVQTAEVMKRFEPVLQAEKPDAVVVVGDVNSTLACSLTAVKMNIPVAHVEAGLRSFRPNNAGGDQPDFDRRNLALALRDRTERLGESQARGDTGREGVLRRKRDDRYAPAASRAMRTVDRPRRSRLGRSWLCGLDVASPRQRRCP